MKKKIILALSVVVFLLPLLSQGRDLSKHFEHVQRSKYFIFHYNDEISTIDSTAAFSDGFVDVISQEYFAAKFSFPIHVYVLRNRGEFQTFLRDKAGVPDPPGWGIYFPELKSFVTYEHSGNGTFAHEIMHPLLRYNLKAAPYWADEGIPSFFEKSFGYWDEDRLVLKVGYQNPWRIRALGADLLSLDLEKIIRSKGSYGTSEKRMASVFLHKNGKLKRYIELVKQNKKNGYGTFFEAAFQKEFYEILPVWQKYLKETYRNRKQISRIPGSEVFSSQEVYERFMKKRGLSF